MFKKVTLCMVCFALALSFAAISGYAADPAIHPMEGVPKLTVKQASVMTHAIGFKEDGSLNFGVTGFSVLVKLSQPGDAVARWNYTQDFNSARTGQVKQLEEGLYEFSFRPEFPATAVYFWFGANSKVTGYPNIKVVKIDQCGVSEIKL